MDLNDFLFYKNEVMDFPGGPVAKDSELPMQGAQVPSWVEELDPSYRS